MKQKKDLPLQKLQSFFFGHDPANLHSYADAFLESAELTAFSGQNGDLAVAVVGTVKAFVAFILHGSPEERLAGAAAQRTEMIRF